MLKSIEFFSEFFENSEAPIVFRETQSKKHSKLTPSSGIIRHQMIILHCKIAKRRYKTNPKSDIKDVDSIIQYLDEFNKKYEP